MIRLLCPCTRIVGPAAVAGNSSAAIAFASALNQSFSEQYAGFDLLVQLSTPVSAASAPSTPSAGELTDWSPCPANMSCPCSVYVLVGHARARRCMGLYVAASQYAAAGRAWSGALA